MATSPKVKSVTLKKGQVITPSELAALVTTPENAEKIGKRIRQLARGPIAYRDVTKDRGKSHGYDVETANAICDAAGFPVKFKIGK